MTTGSAITEKAEYQAKKAKNQLVELFTDLYHLFIRANKPDRKTYTNTVKVVLLGVLIMGFVGFIVKITSIPINNILIGSSSSSTSSTAGP